MSEKEILPDASVTPVPFAGFCTAEGWSKIIYMNQHPSMQLLFAEVLAANRNSVRSGSDNSRRVQISVSRVELIMYAVNRFLKIAGESANTAKLETVFEKFLKSGTPAEWLQMFEICANSETDLSADIKNKFMDALGKKIIGSGFFREMVGLMQILTKKVTGVPGEIVDRHLEMLAAEFKTIADIDEISGQISKKYGLTDI